MGRVEIDVSPALSDGQSARRLQPKLTLPTLENRCHQVCLIGIPGRQGEPDLRTLTPDRPGEAVDQVRPVRTPAVHSTATVVEQIGPIGTARIP